MSSRLTRQHQPTFIDRYELGSVGSANMDFWAPCPQIAQASKGSRFPFDVTIDPARATLQMRSEG